MAPTRDQRRSGRHAGAGPAADGAHAIRASAPPPAFSGGLGRLRRHPRAVAAISTAIAGGAVIAIAAASGFGTVGVAFSHIRPAWIALVAGGQLVGFAGYALAYCVVASTAADGRPSFRLVLRLVAAGFGAYTVGGGFSLDYYAWRGAGQDPTGARIRVLGLGAFEYVVLAPAACVAAIVMLANGSNAQPSLLWPWAIAVPVGFALAFAAARKRERLLNGRRGRRRRLEEAFAALDAVRELLRRPSRGLRAGLGMTLYWTAEIVSLWAAVKLFGASLSASALIVAYATGYAATRRTLPLGGAGTTEALLTLALHWVGLGFGTALAAVIAYRTFNFLLATAPALRARRTIEPLFTEPAGRPARGQRLVA